MVKYSGRNRAQFYCAAEGAAAREEPYPREGNLMPMGTSIQYCIMGLLLDGN